MKMTQDQVVKANIWSKGLTKRYKGSPRLALSDLNLAVFPGEIYGFLGPNGAGKSTTIKLLMNFIQPTGGHATILQCNVTDSVKIKHHVGYLSGDIGIYPKMTGKQYLNYMSDLLPASSHDYLQELVKRFRADLHKKLGHLSRGNRQKVAILQAFMHRPKVLILDEPSNGLDPLMQEEFYALLRESKAGGATIFMSSHNLGEVQKVCDRVGIIREGKLVTERSINEMAATVAQTFDIVFASKPPLTSIMNIPGVRLVSHNDRTVTLSLHGQLASLFAFLSKQKVIKIDTRHLDLEEIFLGFYNPKGSNK
jgi:ABC-2 type transport system ATP-binding protein